MIYKYDCIWLYLIFFIDVKAPNLTILTCFQARQQKLYDMLFLYIDARFHSKALSPLYVKSWFAWRFKG